MMSLRAMYSLFFILLTTTQLQARVIQFYIEPTQRVVPTYVQQLVEGSIERIQQGSRLTASVSLIFDGGYYIMVDTPSATDVKSKEIMLRGIASRNIVPGEVQLVVTTHGHPDHFGQGNFFPNARHFFGSYEYADDNYISTELKHNTSMRLTTNVELWNTPGHTSQDVSVMVHNVPCCGTVAVVGDLFYHEQDAMNGTEWFADAWNPLVGKLNRDKVVCYADYIIPGHGKIFKISEELKKSASCGVPLPPIDTNEISASTPTAGDAGAISFTFTPQPTVTTSAPTSTTTESATTTTSTAPTQSTTVTPFVVTVDHLEELETPPPEITNLMNSVNEALPYVMTNVIQPAAAEMKLTAERQPAGANVLAPVVESAAIQLSKLLKMNLTQPAQDPYPFTTYWKNTLKTIANDVPGLQQAFASYPRIAMPAAVPSSLPAGPMSRLRPLQSPTNQAYPAYLNALRTYQPR